MKLLLIPAAILTACAVTASITALQIIRRMERGHHQC